MTVKIGRLVELGTVRGEPIQRGGYRLIPVAWTVSLSMGRTGTPWSAGLAWARPIAVEVSDATGSRRVPIADVGTRILLGMITVVAGLPLLWLALRRARRPSAKLGGIRS